MHLAAQKFTAETFKNYLDSLPALSWAKFVVVHNTSEPDIALYKQWEARQGKYAHWDEVQWLHNLASYYAGLGWSGTPHLFIPPTSDTILVLNDLRFHGTHTPSWNSISFGVETVGEFESEAFEDPTRTNLVNALALLHQKCGFDPADFQLGVKGLHFHKEDKNTTHKTCPGKHIVKDDLVHAVSVAMGKTVDDQDVDDHVHAVTIAAQEADTSKLNSVELVSMYWFQAALNQWKPSLNLAVNGNRDTPTINATKEFQQAAGLTLVDGIPGPVTRVAIKHLNAA